MKPGGMTGRNPSPRLPFGPLDELVDHRLGVAAVRAHTDPGPVTWLARAAGVSRRRVHYWRLEGGIPAAAADEIAVNAFGLHPGDIWAEWWELPT